MSKTNPISLCLIFIIMSTSALASPRTEPTKITINGDHVLVIDGEKCFPIGFTMPPPPGGKTPEGKDAYQELRDAGGTFIRTGPWVDEEWNEEYFSKEQQYMDAAARVGLLCLPWLKEYSAIHSEEEAEKLRQIVTRFKDHPGMGCWKGADEPEWGMEPVEPLVRAKQIIHEVDPDHPIWIVQAPRGTVDSLRKYNDTMDILGMDIYPVSYPPGVHSLLPNDQISLVGDHTRIIMEVSEGKLPVWMTLQIAWSGVAKEGRTLRFPTFAEERFMAYQAIINGARGLIFFGGHLTNTMTPEDRALGWNWTFWNKVLKPVVQELGDKSPLHPALVARESELPIHCRLVGVSHARPKDVEFCVREVGDEIFILACKREGDTVQVQFTGLPPTEEFGEVMFESPRAVKVEDGTFTDWFGPFDVHVYRFKRKG